jgi:hypothetical protein
MMVMATLLRRIPAGKEAYFELTQAGVEQASRVHRTDLSQQVQRTLERPKLSVLLAAMEQRTSLDDYSAPRTVLPIQALRHHVPRTEKRVGQESRYIAPSEWRKSNGQAGRSREGRSSIAQAPELVHS